MSQNAEDQRRRPVEADALARPPCDADAASVAQRCGSVVAAARPHSAQHLLDDGHQISGSQGPERQGRVAPIRIIVHQGSRQRLEQPPPFFAAESSDVAVEAHSHRICRYQMAASFAGVRGQPRRQAPQRCHYSPISASNSDTHPTHVLVALRRGWAWRGPGFWSWRWCDILRMWRVLGCGCRLGRGRWAGVRSRVLVWLCVSL